MTNRHYPIRMTLLAMAMMSGLHGAAQASDDLQLEYDHLESVRDDQVASVGIGALIGALAGGPPGLIVGIMGMNAIDSYQNPDANGHSADLSAKLADDLPDDWDNDLADQDEQAVVATIDQQEVQTATTVADGPADESAKEVAARELSGQELSARELSEGQLASLSDIEPNRRQDKLLQALVNHFEQWVQFRTAQAELETHLQQQLRRAAAWMSQMPAVRIEIHGFADPRGTDQANLALSRARLDSVRRALIAGGIDASQIIGYAHGESRPLYSGEDVESNNFERRVLISFHIQEARS